MPKTFPMSFLLSAWPLAFALWAVRGRLRSGEGSARPGPGRAITYLGLGLAASGPLFWFDYPVCARTVIYTTVNAQPEREPARIPVMIQHPGVQHYLSFEPAASAFGSVKPFQMRLSIERPRGTVVAATDLNFEVVLVKRARGGQSSVLQGEALNFTPLERGEYQVLLSLRPYVPAPQERFQPDRPLAGPSATPPSLTRHFRSGRGSQQWHLPDRGKNRIPGVAGFQQGICCGRHWCGRGHCPQRPDPGRPSHPGSSPGLARADQWHGPAGLPPLESGSGQGLCAMAGGGAGHRGGRGPALTRHGFSARPGSPPPAPRGSSFGHCGWCAEVGPRGSRPAETLRGKRPPPWRPRFRKTSWRSRRADLPSAAPAGSTRPRRRFRPASRCGPVPGRSRRGGGSD